MGGIFLKHQTIFYGYIIPEGVSVLFEMPSIPYICNADLPYYTGKRYKKFKKAFKIAEKREKKIYGLKFF